jgi:flagella basal body P-ring formation protein FlgA
MSVAMAESFQSHQSIYQAVESFIQTSYSSQHSQKPEINVGKLDSRLKLKKCSKHLQAFSPKGSRELGNTTVGVKCSDKKPWSLHVPVKISIYKDVLVATRVLQKNTVLTEDDIKLAKHDTATLSYGYFEDLKSEIGMKLKRQILAGTVLTPAMLKRPQVITRGQKVTITALSGRMEVRMMGKALDNGAPGERIKVMNLKSRQKLEGVVTATGEVEVGI